MTTAGVLTFLEIRSQGRNPQSKTPETINYALIRVFDPVFVAYELGYFQDIGVEVNLGTESFSGPQAIAAAQSGKVDAGISATPALINAVKSGIGVKALADVQTSFKESPLMIWYVKKDSIIKSPADLRGKKIGVNAIGASFYYTTLVYLKEHGLSDKDVNFVIIPHPNMEQALLSGQIDVAGMIDPYTQKIEDGGEVRKLFDGYEALGEKQFSVIFITNKATKEKPEAVSKFLTAYKRAAQFITENPGKAAQIMSKWMQVDSKFISTHEFVDGAKVKEDDLGWWINNMISNGDLKDFNYSASSLIYKP